MQYRVEEYTAVRDSWSVAEPTCQLGDEFHVEQSRKIDVCRPTYILTSYLALCPNIGY